MRAMDVAVVMMMFVVVVIVIAIRAMHVCLLVHGATPELNLRELCRRYAEYARCVQIKIRF